MESNNKIKRKQGNRTKAQHKPNEIKRNKTKQNETKRKTKMKRK